MCKTRFPLLAFRVTSLLAGIAMTMLISSCSTSESDSASSGIASYLMPPSMQTPARENVQIHSPSAMEALSRGMAAVTPPGAPLQDIYYEFDSTALRDDAKTVLKQNAEWMKNHPTARVEIEGHCDDLGSAEYNLALGAKRAQVAKEFLMTLGVAPDRLVTISYGKEAPACFERTEECRAKNRRARFVNFTELPTS